MLSVSRNSCLILFVQLRSKSRDAVSSVAISADLLLNLAVFSLLGVKFSI